MTISAAGNISSYSFYQAVMYSHARLTYNKVSAMLEQPDTESRLSSLCEQYAHVLPQLHNLYGLYQLLLRKARTERGAIDFETTETKIVSSTPTARLKKSCRLQRNDAHKIIEECMLCANVATAQLPQEIQAAGPVPGSRRPLGRAAECGSAVLERIGVCSSVVATAPPRLITRNCCPTFPIARMPT